MGEIITQLEMEVTNFSAQMQDQAFQFLCSNDIKPMETLFSFLFSNQQSQISEAHNLLLCAKHHHPGLLFIKLLFILRYAPEIDTRSNSAYVLSFFRVQNLWPKLTHSAQENMKTQVLDFIKTEDSMHVLRVSCGFVAELLGEAYKCNGEWPEFLEFLEGLLASGIDKFQEISLLVFAKLPDEGRRLICVALFSRVEVLYKGVLSSLNSKNVDVKIAAFGAVISLVHLFSVSLNVDRLNILLCKMMTELFDLLKRSEQESARQGLQEFVRLAREEPQVLKSCVNYLVSGMLKIAESENLKAETKICAFQFLTNVLKVKDLALELLILPSERLFLIAMEMLPGTPYDDLWSEMRSLEDDTPREIGTYSWGIKFLSQMSNVSSPQNIVCIAFKILPTYVNACQWQKREAGITMLAVISNSKECSYEIALMGDYLNQAVNIITKSFKDTSPEVRLAAFHFMQLPTDLVGVIQTIHHSRIWPAFIAALDRSQVSRVEEEIVSAILCFLKSIPPNCLAGFTNPDVLTRRLLRLLERGRNKSAQCRAIAMRTFNTLAAQLDGVCLEYCARYLPVLLQACSDTKSELKKEAMYGIRICVEFGGAAFRHLIKNVLITLGNVIAYPNQSCVEDLKASDIAVSAVGKIFEFHQDFINEIELVPIWLNYLPLKNDLTAAKDVHDQLCSMVERSEGQLFNSNYELLRKILSIFIEVISEGDKLATLQTLGRMRNWLKRMWVTYPDTLLNPIIFSLPANHQQVLIMEIGSAN
ncbi:importin subunit beta-3-like [Mercurialis annua]|uniref:importin subunit beta-3-like n=1 Tax=Mercurialis annua TaxID=3986 RepID=UPI00215FEC39|nr:importin subunit beta-3-like [Mercurialis annua]